MAQTQTREEYIVGDKPNRDGGSYAGPERRRHPDYGTQISVLRLTCTILVGIVLLLGAVASFLAMDVGSRIDAVSTRLDQHIAIHSSCPID